jgi:tRNA1Val (adenine37-N6)-methyltransferase
MSIFRFKQFNVDQAGCAMKINTDGVLIGALANGNNVDNILDIGTGTGVISLMLAQRFTNAQIDAVELDETAARTARANFEQSPFHGRLTLNAQSFQAYFVQQSVKKFGLIVTNPPFYIQSLPSPGIEKAMAKHADDTFFKDLISGCAAHLTLNGQLWMVLPINTSSLVKQLALEQQLFVQQVISILSYPHSHPHREILAFGYKQTEIMEQRLVIYDAPKVYTNRYQDVLKDFLTIF